MALTTYTELQDAIASFLDRSDLTSIIPTFIAMAEAQINRDVRHWKMESRALATFDEGFETIPTDWVETVRLATASGNEIKRISSGEMLAIRDSGETGEARVYCFTAGQFEVYPVPDGQAELIYLAKVPSLSGTNADNWLLIDAPDVYLYGSLVHSAGYLKDDNRAGLWGGMYAAAVENLNKQSAAARFSGPLAMGVPR